MAFFVYNQSKYHEISSYANTQISVLQAEIITQSAQINAAEYLFLNDQINESSSNTINSIAFQQIGEYDPVVLFESNAIFSIWDSPIEDFANDGFTIVYPYPWPILAYTFANTEISLYSSNTVSQLADTRLQKFTLNSSIEGFANTLISTKQNNPIEYGYYHHDDSIVSTTVVSETVMGTIFDIESLTATTSISTDAELVLQIGGATLISVASTESVSTDNEMLNRRFIDSDSITSTASIVDTNELQLSIEVNTITSTESFENDLEALLEIGGATLISVESGLDVGILQLDRQFTLDSIESNIQFGLDVLTLYIGVEGTNLVSVESTESFGTPVFSDFVHRSLIFKNDNITKITNGDAAEIAGGIVVESSSKISTTSANGSYSVPSHAAGFISVIIDGVSYKMPYYNPGE